jgi:hypothetical protein
VDVYKSFTEAQHILSNSTVAKHFLPNRWELPEATSRAGFIEASNGLLTISAIRKISLVLHL